MDNVNDTQVAPVVETVTLVHYITAEEEKQIQHHEPKESLSPDWKKERKYKRRPGAQKYSEKTLKYDRGRKKKDPLPGAKQKDKDHEHIRKIRKARQRMRYL